MINDNILLITDKDDVTNNILSKLVLLRESDSVAVHNYEKDLILNSQASVIILHQKDDEKETLEFIKAINSDNYEIILLLNEYKQDFVLSAYDLGIRDYFSINSEAYEMLIKTINCFKYNKMKINYLRSQSLLASLSAIDGNTGFYNYQSSRYIFDELIKDKRYSNGIFALVSLDEQSKTKCTIEKLSNAIKNAIRCDDIVIKAKGGKFYLLLPNIDKTGISTIIDKISKSLKSGISIKAGICRIANKSLPELEKEAFAALSEAKQTNKIFVYLEEKLHTLDKWLTDDEKNNKNYKLFKNAYNNKLEKVITPVFFRLQKTYESKLHNTKIEQYCNELQSVFYLKNKYQESKLKIIYPGFAKIVIYIIHEGLDSPENREITLNLNEIDIKGLSKIVEGFIKEFKSVKK